jgi:hypothetical protein
MSVQIFRASVPEPSMLALAMQTDFNGDTPLVELQRMIIEAANRSTAASCCGDEELRKKMFITLVAAGGTRPTVCAARVCMWVLQVQA